MGTSASSKGPLGSNPLVPPWAQEGDQLVVSDGNTDDLEVDNSTIQSEVAQPNANTSDKRFQPARKGFGDYAKSGNRSDLKKALRSYSKGSTGGGRGASKRLASGITAGAGLFGLLQDNKVTAQNQDLRLSDLSGLNTDQAIDRITEHLTPDSADADNVRSSLNYALSEVLMETEQFDDINLTPESISEIFTYYITDLIFQQVVIDMGQAWFHAETALRQLAMETELRELIKVIVGSKLFDASNGHLATVSKEQITQIQIEAISETVEEWESFE